MKLIFIIICDDGLYGEGGKTINAIKYFHPEAKVMRIGTDQINKVKKELNCNDIRFIAPRICNKIWEQEKPDILIKMGADCLVLGRIDEVLSLNYDIAAPCNDSFYIGDRDERINRPDKLRNLRNIYWINCDTIIIKNKEFINKWEELTSDFWTGKELALQYFERLDKGDDQSSLNIVAHLYGFKLCILDLVNLKYCYGATANWSGEKNFIGNLVPSIKKNGCQSWPAWNSFFEKNGETKLPDNGIGLGERTVKIIHMGGGTFEPKLGFDLFNPEYRKHLKKITGFDE